MALTVSMAAVNPTMVVAGAQSFFTVTVANTGAAAVTLNSLTVVESTESDARVSGPQFLTPNMPVGLGSPVIPAAGSATYSFSAIFTNPVLPGPSPQNAPGGASPSNASSVPDPFFTLLAQGQTSDGSVFSSTLVVGVLSAGNEVAIAQGGAFQFAAGANLINGITTSAL